LYLVSLKIGTIDIKTDRTLFLTFSAANIPAGNYKLRFVFTHATGSGYKIEFPPGIIPSDSFLQ
jgi:hypothetical protein